MVVRIVPVTQAITRKDEWLSVACAIERIAEINGSPDHSSRFDKKISFQEYIAQMAESVGAEIAVAHYLGIKDFDPRQSRFKKTADVGSQFEVKWTKWEAGALIIGDNDRNQDIAILCTGRSPHFVIRGWIPVSIAKDKRWRRQDQPTFWVDQYHLRPIENLRRSSYGEAALHLQG